MADRWNTGASIKIDTIPKELIGEAIESWAEGSKPLKDLLWKCYESGITTYGSHYGHGSYIDFEGTEHVEQLKRMLKHVGDINCLQILCLEEPINPQALISGITPCVGIGVLQQNTESGDELFSKLIKGFGEKIPEKGCFGTILDFYKFFEGKETGLGFRLRHSKESGYEFTIESHEKKHNIEYCENLFTKAGLTRKTINPDYPVIEWEIQSHDKKEFDEMMARAFEYVSREWNLDTPTEIADDMGFMMKLRIMYRKLAGTPEGRQKLYNWARDNAPESYRRIYGKSGPEKE